jgi:hypothetical protein
MPHVFGMNLPFLFRRVFTVNGYNVKADHLALRSPLRYPPALLRFQLR